MVADRTRHRRCRRVWNSGLMSHSAVVIAPTGDILTEQADVAKIRAAMSEAGASVYVAKSVVVPPSSETIICTVYDWGRTDGMPANRKAWALYGWSPMFGPVHLSTDSGRDLPDELVDMIQQPLAVWVPEEIVAVMERTIGYLR